MLLGQLALLAAALFTGAAFYIGWAEQPARLGLDDRALLAQWQPAYRQGLRMQVALVVLATGFGLAAWLVRDRAGYVLGALLMLANVPVTLRVILPVNRPLMATEPEAAGPETRALIRRWGHLHAIRTALGASACISFLIASVT